MIRFLMSFLLAVSFISGCATFGGHQYAEYDKAGKLLQDKKYSEAIAAYDNVAKASSGSSLGANALFSAAKTRLLYDPHHEYAVALQQFDEFLRKYPGNSKAEEARNWRSAARIVLELKRENDRLNEKIDQLRKIDIRHEKRREGK